MQAITTCRLRAPMRLPHWRVLVHSRLFPKGDIEMGNESLRGGCERTPAAVRCADGYGRGPSCSHIRTTIFRPLDSIPRDGAPRLSLKDPEHPSR